MFKRFVCLLGMCLCVMFSLYGTCFAVRLLEKEAALKKVFGSDAVIVAETKELAEPKLSKITERLGGSLVFHQKGSKSAEVEPKTSIDFYFATKGGQKTGVAIIDEEPGKWGPVEFIVAMDLKGTVTRVEVMNYTEKRGQPIARRSFLSQFEGKTGKDALRVNKDIVGISGATISSNAASFTVKKAIALYEEINLK